MPQCIRRRTGGVELVIVIAALSFGESARGQGAWEVSTGVGFGASPGVQPTIEPAWTFAPETRARGRRPRTTTPD